MLDPTYETSTTAQPAPQLEQIKAPHLRLVDQPDRQLHPLLAKRDPNLVRRFYPLLTWLVDRYYRTEVQGAENLSDQACMMVATHNGGAFTPDAYGLAVAFWRRFGLETPAYGMAHRAVFSIPGFGHMLEKLGAIHACRENAELALRSNFPIFVCPGGDLDTLKPFSQRHRIIFAGRRGFIRTAIREQVPIIPVVSVGAHEVVFILHDGRRLAKLLGLTRFRVKTCPLTLTFPFGITLAGLPALPLPSKVVLRVLPKIELDEPPEAANDPAIVERCTTHVRSLMQAAVDDLASKRGLPVLG